MPDVNGPFSQSIPLQMVSGNLGGGSWPSSFVFTQATASKVWDIAHGLNRNPYLTIFDNLGNTIIGDIVYTSTNSLKITFSVAVSGIANLS